jgi:hypothetical protein
MLRKKRAVDGCLFLYYRAYLLIGNIVVVLRAKVFLGLIEKFYAIMYVIYINVPTINVEVGTGLI